MSEDERPWTGESARRERVPMGLCLWCKTPREDLPAGTTMYSLETYERLCEDCVETLRRFDRDLDLLVRVAPSVQRGEDSEVVDEVVESCFHYLVEALGEGSLVLLRPPRGMERVGVAFVGVDS